jgi:hypothetical protein
MALLTDIYWSTIFTKLLDIAQLDIRKNLWFMPDGAPAHISYVVRNYVETAYTERWIGRQEPVS